MANSKFPAKEGKNEGVQLRIRPSKTVIVIREIYIKAAIPIMLRRKEAFGQIFFWETFFVAIVSASFAKVGFYLPVNKLNFYLVIKTS